MARPLRLRAYSLGIGDRFGCEGKAQLRALQAARNLGVRVTPVWNKSNRAQPPEPGTVAHWSSEEFVRALRHNPSSEYFNPHLRQLVHVGFKVAAEMGTRFTSLLEKHRELIEPFVTENILTNHIHPLFVGHAPAESAGRGSRGTKSAAKAAR